MKTPESCYRQAAEELGLPIELIKRVNTFYWKEGIKKNLTEINYSSLFIKNLGTIVVSKYKLYVQISILIKKIRGVRISKKYTEDKRTVIIEGYKNNLRKLLKMRNKLAKQYEQVV